MPTRRFPVLPIALSSLLLASPWASAQSEPSSAPASLPVIGEPAAWWRSLALFGALLLVSVLVNLLRRGERAKLRRPLLLFFLHLVALGTAYGLAALGSAVWAERALITASLLGAFVLVHLLAIGFFVVFLNGLQVAVTSIASELAVAGGYIVSIIVVLAGVGVDATSLLTASTVVTAVVGLSLQKTLGNILGGIALQVDDSIAVGDWIQLGDGPQGKVTQIRWRHTVVETRNWDTMIIPNATLLDSTITILGRRNNTSAPHRMWVYFSVDYRFSPGEVCRIVQEALRNSPITRVAQDPPPNCICYDLSRPNFTSVAYYAVRYYLTDLDKDDPTSSEVRDRIVAALNRAGIPLAVPAQMVFTAEKDQEYRRVHWEREKARRLEALDTVDIFDALSREEKDKLSDRLRPAPFAAGEIMTRQGMVAHWLYIMPKGKAEVRIENNTGGEEIVAQLEGPTFFGEMALLTGESRRATVIAVTDTQCYRLDKDAFQGIVQGRPQVAKEISEILAARQVELDAARDQLNTEGRERQKRDQASLFFESIQNFFGA
jgi:small-conductance mechanosensitive channel/CRP-like cAMP-binding protein